MTTRVGPRVSRAAASALRVLVAATSIVVLGGCAAKWPDAPPSPAAAHDIHVVSHGWHTGVVLARDDLGDALAFVRDELGEAPWYEFGWGDKGFYQAREITSGLAVRAVFWPTDSVMHVVAVPLPPDRYFVASEAIRVPLSAAGAAGVAGAIAASFAPPEGGAAPSPTKRGLYGHSLFFDGEGSYHLLRTCNTWTARTLTAGDVPIRAFLTLTAGSVMGQVGGALEDLYEARPDLREPSPPPVVEPRLGSAPGGP